VPETRYAVAAFLAMASATFATRLLPFLLPRGQQRSPHLRFIGANLPPAVMLLLVVYCLKDVPLRAAPYGVPEGASIALIVALHLWRRNGLLSIGAGTACYMTLARVLAA
jgi:branched-subunit amino acid transport protein AzlD